MTLKCTICKIGDACYKCPRCKAPFCSVKCGKIHKQACPGVLKSESPKEPEAPRSPFDKLRDIPNITNPLGDPRLQAIITRIDSADDRESELIKEMECNPYFKEFVDNLMKVVPPEIQP